MLKEPKYSFVFWGTGPHNAVSTIIEVRNFINTSVAHQIEWCLPNREKTPLPITKDNLYSLEDCIRSLSQYHAFSLFLESSNNLSLSLTIDAPKHVRNFDVLTLSFEKELLDPPNPFLTFEILETIFYGLVKQFTPFWAALVDPDLYTREFQELTFRIDRTKIPETIHWFNFFDLQMAERLGGLSKIQELSAYKIEEINNPPGIVLILQQEQFDIHGRHSKLLLKEAFETLDLESVQTLYKKPKRR